MTVFKTLTKASQALANKQTSAQELMRQVLEQANTSEDKIHAYCYLDQEQALQAARRVDQELSQTGLRSPLHGMPVGIKDLLATQDMPTRAGSKVYTEDKPFKDADIVANLRALGAVIVGKQQTHEFGFGMNTPTTRSPWNLEDYPGGSSIGGLASVVAGSCLAAFGTDGGGSIRKPAALNGLVGFKPSLGAVSTQGIFPSQISVDHIGWLTRTVADSALIYQSLEQVQPTRKASLKGLKIGCIEQMFEAIEPSILDAVEAALSKLNQAGSQVQRFSLPLFKKAGAHHGTIVMKESAGIHRQALLDRPQDFEPGSMAFLTQGSQLSCFDWQQANAFRNQLAWTIDQHMQQLDLDVLVSPTVPIPTVPMSEMDPVKLLPEYTRLTAPINLTGQPAISLPCGYNSRNMPVGLQLIGRFGADLKLLNIAQNVEELLAWQLPKTLAGIDI